MLRHLNNAAPGLRSLRIRRLPPAVCSRRSGPRARPLPPASGKRCGRRRRPARLPAGARGWPPPHSHPSSAAVRGLAALLTTVTPGTGGGGADVAACVALRLTVISGGNLGGSGRHRCRDAVATAVRHDACCRRLRRPPLGVVGCDVLTKKKASRGGNGAAAAVVASLLTTRNTTSTISAAARVRTRCACSYLMPSCASAARMTWQRRTPYALATRAAVDAYRRGTNTPASPSNCIVCHSTSRTGSNKQCGHYGRMKIAPSYCATCTASDNTSPHTHARVWVRRR